MSQLGILVIEDDPAIRRGIVHALKFHGYQVSEASDGPTGREAALGTASDLILLDLVLPGGDGLDILREIRGFGRRVPVIILTARGEEDDRVTGLKLGADDYVVKPFSVKELLARVEAVLRRSAEREDEPMELPIPGGTLDRNRGQILFDDGTTSQLGEKEGDLLEYFIKNRGRVISRDELLARVWQLNPDVVETRTVDMHVARLREKLRDEPEHPRIIVTVRGRGYSFEDGG